MKNDFKKERTWLVRDKYAGLDIPEALALDLARLKSGEPLDYIIGWKPFLGCQIDLSFRPLIPRDDTEFWVEKAIEDVKSFSGKTGPKVLDIFAGSGCVGLAVLKNCPGAKVDLAEKSAKQIEQIELNLKMNKLRGKVFRSNIFSGVAGKYDFILANPPYVPAGRKLSRAVSDFEPKAALFSGPDGLRTIKKFLHEAPSRLNKGGTLYMEFDSGQKRALEKIFKLDGWLDAEFFRDGQGRWRYLIAKRGK